MSLKDVIDEISRAHAAIDEATARLGSMERDTMLQLTAAAGSVQAPATVEEAAVCYVRAAQQMRACAELLSMQHAPMGGGDWGYFVRNAADYAIDALRRVRP